MAAAALLAPASVRATGMLEAAEQRVVEQINRLRSDAGARPLEREAHLDTAAAHFANFIAQTDRYGHDADGRAPAERVQAWGYVACLVAENLAYQFDSRPVDAPTLASRLVEGWAASPPHRRNALDADALHTGVGIAKSRRSGRHYAVQLFARPQAQALSFAITNRTREPVQYRFGDQARSLPPGVTHRHNSCRQGLLELQAGPRVQPVSGASYEVEATAGRGLSLRSLRGRPRPPRRGPARRAAPDRSAARARRPAPPPSRSPARPARARPPCPLRYPPGAATACRSP